MKKLIDILDKFQLMAQLIEQEHTGSPEEFSQRLGISRSTLYEMLEELKDHDVSIRFSRCKNSFIYMSEVEVDIKFSVKHLDSEEEKTVSGGKSFFFRPEISDGSLLSLQPR